MNRLGVSAFQLILALTFFSLTFLVASASDADSITSEEQAVEVSEVEPKEAIVEVSEIEKEDYTSSISDVSFSYPKEWNVQDRVINSIPYTRLENTDSKDLQSHSSQESYFKIEILSFPDKGLSLDAWVRQQNKRSQPGQNILDTKEIEVDGERAIYQLEEYTVYNHISQAVFVAKGDQVFIINFSNNKEENKAVVDEFLSSFHFNSEL